MKINRKVCSMKHFKSYISVLMALAIIQFAAAQQASVTADSTKKTLPDSKIPLKGPDLIIEKIIINDGKGITCDQISYQFNFKVNYTLRNIGNVKAGTSTTLISIRVGCLPIGQEFILDQILEPYLPAGGTNEVTRTISLADGACEKGFCYGNVPMPLTLLVTADFPRHGVVRETNEDNNCSEGFSITCKCKKLTTP